MKVLREQKVVDVFFQNWQVVQQTQKVFQNLNAEHTEVKLDFS